jgi:ankyrin repeat protein
MLICVTGKVTAKNKRWDVAELLSQRNADVTICEWTCNNVLHLAADSGHTKFVGYLPNTKRMAIECRNSLTKLHCGSQLSLVCLEVIEMLLKHKANLHVKDRGGHISRRSN